MIDEEFIDIVGFKVKPFTSVKAAADWIMTRQNGLYKGAAIALNAEKIINNIDHPPYIRKMESFSFFYPDGMPIIWLLRRRGIQSARVPGVELWEELMKRAGILGLRVYLLGGSEDVNKATCDKLELEYGITNIRRQNGFFDDQNVILDDIKSFCPDIVTVAQGSPRQEKFIVAAFETYPDAFYMGVGGTYDVYTGKVTRAPHWMRSNGLEFLYRLFKSPTRLPRYVSLIRFLKLYLLYRI